jgi:hypothetical protein
MNDTNKAQGEWRKGQKVIEEGGNEGKIYDIKTFENGVTRLLVDCSSNTPYWTDSRNVTPSSGEGKGQGEQKDGWQDFANRQKWPDDEAMRVMNETSNRLFSSTPTSLSSQQQEGNDLPKEEKWKFSELKEHYENRGKEIDRLQQQISVLQEQLAQQKEQPK